MSKYIIILLLLFGLEFQAGASPYYYELMNPFGIPTVTFKNLPHTTWKVSVNKRFIW